MSGKNPRDVVLALREKFESGAVTYNAATGYPEAETRSQFIDPLLGALGWDVSNSEGLIPSRREVLLEVNQERENSSAKKPDYTLRVNGVGRVHIEAKKPFVNIRRDLRSVFQARRYGYTDRHALVVLTNYKDLVVYDATVPVDEERDQPETALLHRWSFSEYEDRWDEITAVLGRDAMNDPGWEGEFRAVGPEALPADRNFIQHFNGWRVELGDDMVRRDPGLSEETVNDAVQRLLNRLIFVRMCEDRGIEGENTLREAFSGTATDVTALFARLDERYNTGLFATNPPRTDPALLVGTEVLGSIVDRLYSPRSPFSFAVLDADFLGLVYESSLAQHLRIVDEGQVPRTDLAPKREYAKRDVVTTPQSLVDATVTEALARLDKSVRHPKVLDFATGSGRFLLSAFNRAVERETQRRLADERSTLLKIGQSEWRLSFESKKLLLAENFFGIDIDFNAVETARFSLLIRLLDDESAETLPQGKRILPDITANIIHGNTLVRDLPGASVEQLTLTNPLDLSLSRLPEKFDIIVGNPPYVNTELMKNLDPCEFNYLKRNYQTAYKQFDKYFTFVEFAVKHLAEGGVLGAVIPNKWITVVAAEELRSLLRTEVSLEWLTNFRHVRVFSEKLIYVAALVARKGGSRGPLLYSEPESFEQFGLGRATVVELGRELLPASFSAPWVLPSSEVEQRVLASIRQRSIPLGEVVEARNGAQTSRNDVYILKKATVLEETLQFLKKDPATKREVRWEVERAVTRAYLDDSRGVRSHRTVRADAHIIFPYRKTESATGGTGYAVIPENEMKEEFPLAYSYLLAHRPGLDKRDVNPGERAKAFYVYGRTQAIGYCTDAPKIFYSNNQTGEKYGLDTCGIAYQSGGTGGEVALYPGTLGYSLDFVLALLDQRPIEFFLRKRGSAFQGGYYARGTDVIADVPVPLLDFSDPDDNAFHDAVASGMACLRALHDREGTVPERGLTQHRTEVQKRMRAIRELFLDRWGMSSADVAALRI